MKKVMMTVFKIVLILIAVVVVGVVALILFALHKESNYYKYTEAVGEIEQKYTAFGDKEVSCQEYDANDDVIGKYAVWYPSELESSNTQYPVVIFANGTGSTSSTYKPFLTHLSSWGFISVGNDDENTRTGASLEETIKFLIAENEKKDSIFYHKIDLDNIGIAGHSQGGPAVFNMVTNQEHGSMVKALYAASATSSYHTMVMADGWEYDISRVNIPTFLTAGTGSWDAGNATSKEQVTDNKNGVAQGICPLWSLQENYSLLPETVDKVIARKKNVDHGDSYKQFDGYMTAWFVYRKVTQKPGKRLPLEENCLPTAYIKMYRQISMNKVYGTAQFICCSKDMKRHPKHLWARMPNFFQYALSGCRTGCRKELVCA